MRIITQPIYSPTLGLDDRIASTMKNVRAAEKITNFRIANGEIRKDWGYVTYGSNQPLLGTSCSLSVYREYNSTLTPHCLTSKYIYEYETASDRWNVVGRGTLLDNCEDAWDAAANVICDVSTDEKRGANSASIAIAAAFGTGLAADEDISASDVTDDTYLHFWIKSNIATAAGD